MRNRLASRKGGTWALVGALAAIVACGGSSSTSGADGGAGGGGGGGLAAACGAAFDAQVAYQQACAGAQAFALGSRDRAVQACELNIGAPGVASNAGSAVQACASAEQANTSSCNEAAVGSACALPAGTLANGAACGENEQCQSLHCKGSGLKASIGASGAVSYSESCGVCADAIPVGQPCAQGDTCAQGATCAFGAGATGTCTAQSDVGGPCAMPGGFGCKPGLHCSASLACAAPSDVGGACLVWSDCKSPLTCANGACAQGKNQGEACTAASDCNRAFTCDLASKTCMPVAPVDPGAACDDAAHPCKVGFCAIADLSVGTGTCPTVIPDGQPCTNPMPANQTCDADAYCINGKCQMFDPSTCK